MEFTIDHVVNIWFFPIDSPVQTWIFPGKVNDQSHRLSQSEVILPHPRSRSRSAGQDRWSLAVTSFSCHSWDGLPGLVNVNKKRWKITIFNGKSQFLMGKTTINGHFHWKTNITMERSTIFNRKIHYKLPFSMAIC